MIAVGALHDEGARVLPKSKVDLYAAIRRDSLVTSLTARHLAHLPPDKRPLPSAAHYDQLLRHRRPDSPTT